jgi:hypothetical protein
MSGKAHEARTKASGTGRPEARGREQSQGSVAYSSKRGLESGEVVERQVRPRTDARGGGRTTTGDGTREGQDRARPGLDSRSSSGQRWSDVSEEGSRGAKGRWAKPSEVRSKGRNERLEESEPRIDDRDLRELGRLQKENKALNEIHSKLKSEIQGVDARSNKRIKRIEVLSQELRNERGTIRERDTKIEKLMDEVKEGRDALLVSEKEWDYLGNMNLMWELDWQKQIQKAKDLASEVTSAVNYNSAVLTNVKAERDKAGLKIKKLEEDFENERDELQGKILLLRGDNESSVCLLRRRLEEVEEYGRGYENALGELREQGAALNELLRARDREIERLTPFETH